MNDRHAKIKDRIRKLLALSKSPYEEEAATALAKAQELLSKERLSLSDLTTDERGIVELSVESEPHINPWEKKLLACILSVTYTEALKVYAGDREQLVLIGREANVVTAKILYEYLHEAVERKACMFRDSIDDLESFRIGIVDSIRKKLRERVASPESISRDLVVAMHKERKNENREYIAEHFGSPDSGDDWYGVDPNSYGLGQGIGKKISVDRQLSSVQSEKKT